MKKILSIIFLGLIVTSNTMAYEELNYQIVEKNKIYEIEQVFEKLNIKFKSFIDNPNHYDRTFFVSSGLGWQGKSTMMLTPWTRSRCTI